MGKVKPPKPPAIPTTPDTTPILSGYSSDKNLNTLALPNPQEIPRINNKAVKTQTFKLISNLTSPVVVLINKAV